jgi:hypothetical protein
MLSTDYKLFRFPDNNARRIKAFLGSRQSPAKQATSKRKTLSETSIKVGVDLETIYQQMLAKNPHKMSNIRFFYRLTTLFLFFLPPVFNVPKNLSLPSPALCASRIKHHTATKGSSYYFAWLEKDTRNLFLNWLDARNWCRERCMDLISMESPEEIQLVRSSMQKCKCHFSFITTTFI